MPSLKPKPKALVSRKSGSGTQLDPTITWLVEPPSEPRRKGNDQALRELGQRGYTHIWVRHCDHSTTRVINGCGMKETVPADKHITVYCGNDPKTPNKQGHVFVRVNNGEWRMMEDHERSIDHEQRPNLKGHQGPRPKMRALELFKYSSAR